MSTQTITQEEFENLQQAMNVVCGYCENDECEKCIITRLEEDAYLEVEKDF